MIGEGNNYDGCVRCQTKSVLKMIGGLIKELGYDKRLFF